MVELLEYLRANDFMTYIVSGGGIEFMRPMTEAVYGVPAQQVIGSSIKTKYEMQDGKPVGINTFIGKRPLAAFGNSAGDREMLQWTAAGDGARLMMLVFHDDAEREYAYGPADGLPDTMFGTFPQDLSLRSVESDLEKRRDSSVLWAAWNRRVPTDFGGFSPSSDVEDRLGH